MTRDTEILSDSNLDAIEHWLDRAFRLPGTDIRFGLDAVLGLLPGVGDTATAVVSGAMIVAGLRAGLPCGAIGRMVWNVGIDWALGSIPLIGDLFDVAHKANTKNLAILRAELAKRQAERLEPDKP